MSAHAPFAMFVAGSMILVACAGAAAQSREAGKDPPGDYIKVEVKGRLNSQVFAIGGETTGVQITAAGATWELELGRDAALRELARKLHEKTVVVTGELRVTPGVEIPQRWIVSVATLREAGAGGEKP